VALYRHLDYDFKSGQTQSLELSGPMVGVAFRW
jgi:hypothetical protein